MRIPVRRRSLLGFGPRWLALTSALVGSGCTPSLASPERTLPSRIAIEDVDQLRLLEHVPARRGDPLLHRTGARRPLPGQGLPTSPRQTRRSRRSPSGAGAGVDADDDVDRRDRLRARSAGACLDGLLDPQARHAVGRRVGEAPGRRHHDRHRPRRRLPRLGLPLPDRRPQRPGRRPPLRALRSLDDRYRALPLRRLLRRPILP